MIIQIGRIGDNIICNRDYRDVKDKGEIAHILMELEFIKDDLKELWIEQCEEEANG
jgi:hypothetical protein